MSCCPCAAPAQITLDLVVLQDDVFFFLVFLMVFMIMLIPVGFGCRQHVASTSYVIWKRGVRHNIKKKAKPGYRMIMLMAPPPKSLPPQKKSTHTYTRRIIIFSSFYYSTAYSIHTHTSIPSYSKCSRELFQLFLYLKSLFLLDSLPRIQQFHKGLLCVTRQ